MKQIVLISCVSKKRDERAKVKDLYISELFKSSLAYAHSLNPDKIFILSALHHLVSLNEEIEPYNATLSNVAKSKRKAGLKVLNPAEKKEWGKKVIAQLTEQADLKNDNFIFLAGQAYIKPLAYKFPNCEEPLKGLRQGERVPFLKNKLRIS